MITIDIRGMDELQSALRNLATEQMPFAISTALNTTAFGVQKHEKNRLTSVFDRPTPLTKGMFRVEKATKQNLTAMVYADPKREPVMLLHEFGGARRGDQKMERFLRSKGWLTPGWRAVPTNKMPVNAYGNPKPAKVNQLIKDLPGLSGIKGEDDRAFVIPPGRMKGLPPGVYRIEPATHGHRIEKFYMFVSVAMYKKRLGFAETAMEEAIRLLPNAMNRAIQRAIATAR